jgi:hypothetical protein
MGLASITFDEKREGFSRDRQGVRARISISVASTRLSLGASSAAGVCLLAVFSMNWRVSSISASVSDSLAHASGRRNSQLISTRRRKAPAMAAGGGDIPLDVMHRRIREALVYPCW